MIIHARAPVRIDLAGGWTDVEPFALDHGGCVVNAAINRYSYATLHPRGDARIMIRSADFDTAISVRTFRDLEYDGNLDLIKAAIRRLKLRRGMDLNVRCDAPPSSGVGSSASISICLLGLLNAVQNEPLSHHELAELAWRIETQELQIPGGRQDQYAAAVGGVNFMEFRNGGVSTSQLRLPPAAVNDLEKHLVLCYTGKSRLSGDIIAKVMGAYTGGARGTVRALLRLKEIARQMKGALLRADGEAFGRLLAENWECQKMLHPSVTNNRVERVFAAARKAGAMAGKALGAGGGGCLLFYCRRDTEHLVRRAVAKSGSTVIDFNLEFDGVQVWRM